MSAFEYVMVPVSIVLALALGKVLVAILSSVQSDKKDWIHLLWCAVIILLGMGQWASYWRLQMNEVWGAPEFFLATLGPILLYSAAHILVAYVCAKKVSYLGCADSPAFYHSNCRHYHCCDPQARSMGIGAQRGFLVAASISHTLERNVYLVVQPYPRR